MLVEVGNSFFHVKEPLQPGEVSLLSSEVKGGFYRFTSELNSIPTDPWTVTWAGCPSIVYRNDLYKFNLSSLRASSPLLEELPFYVSDLPEMAGEAIELITRRTPILVDSYVRKPFVQLSSVGVELEGNWKESRDDLFSDTSVASIPDFYSGEIHYHSSTSRIKKLYDFILKNYPDRVGEDCGLHIHLKFIGNRGFKKYLINYDLYSAVLAALREFSHCLNEREAYILSKRLNGYNSYCSDYLSRTEFYYMSVEQACSEDKHPVRNFHFNYCWGFHYSSDLEIRVLPMFENPKTSIKSIALIIETIERYLSSFYEKVYLWKV